MERAFQFTINWSDATDKKFRLSNVISDPFRSPTIPSKDEWYDIELTYDHMSGTFDLTVLREDGSVFVNDRNVPVTLETGFDQILIGEIQGGSRYGSQAQVRVDDIVIER